MTMTINPKDEIYIYTTSIFGWGQGKTIGEAFKNMKNASRGWIEKNYTATTSTDFGKKPRKHDIAELMDKQLVRVFVSNAPSLGWSMYCPVLKEEDKEKGYWVMFLGDEEYTAKFTAYTED